MSDKNEGLNDRLERKKRVKRMKTGLLWLLITWMLALMLISVTLIAKVHSLQEQIDIITENTIRSQQVDQQENHMPNTGKKYESVTGEVTLGSTDKTVLSVNVKKAAQGTDTGGSEQKDNEKAEKKDTVQKAQKERKIYLTFDDGPSEENRALILDILKERGIKATFFVIGENVRKHPDIAKRIVEEGHTIGIHCNCHEYETLYRDVDSYLRDFQKAYDAVKEITGADARLFRFPGGSMNDYNKDVYQEIIEAMTEQGYIYYDWNASLEDAVGKREPQTLIRNAVTSAQGRKRVVMLAHDVVRQTALCLDELLEQFPEYQIRPLLEESEPVQF